MIDIVTIHEPQTRQRRVLHGALSSDARVLAALNGSPQATVARLLGVTKPTLHAKLQRMATDGLVFRSSCGAWLPADWKDCPSCGGRGFVRPEAQ